MNKHRFNYWVLGGMALLMSACNNGASDLLEPKLYFENREYTFSVEDEIDMKVFDLSSRLSSAVSSQVDVSYTIADQSVLDEYNARYGTVYEMLDASNVKLSSTASAIPSGKLYAENVTLELSNLKTLEDGKSYAVPVRVQSNSMSTLPGTSIAYFVLTKPLKIMKVGTFNSHYISVKFPVGTFFTSLTYEALVYLDWFDFNNTIMGTEGQVILRIGDANGGTTPRDILEIAGTQGYKVKEKLEANRWYHIAFTYDQPSGKTAIYVNGSKWAESNWVLPGLDPNSDVGFNIGKIPRFQWGERPLHGKMCELRVWSVARTENQLRQNVLTVDPKSDGLELYYKLNGTEVEEGGVITDSTGKIKGTTNGIKITTLDTPVAIE